MNYISNSIDDTTELAYSIAERVSSGTVIALIGDLGAGKTTFTQAFANSIGITETVVSPTFKLVSEYQGNELCLYHIDAYRMKGSQEFLNIGGEKYLVPTNGITIIEWADILSPLLPNNIINITFNRIRNNPNGRKIIITGFTDD